MLRGAVLFNVRDRDLGSTVQEAIEKIGHAVTGMPQGYYLEWSGQYENLIRGKQTLMLIAPIVLVIIFISLYLAFKSIREAILSLITIPFALIGGAYIRSEEHTSELQSLMRISYAVFCLKKKKNNNLINTTSQITE